MKRPGPKLTPLELTDDERAELQRWTRQRKLSQDVVLRARIVLACDRVDSGGLPVSQSQVARDLRVSVVTVRKWRRRFTEMRLAGLADAPRPGRPRALPDDRVAELVAEVAGSGRELLPTRVVAARAGVSQSTVFRALHAPVPRSGGTEVR
ncbi:hypothetical protein GCM10007079_23780 [Nocardiopsis terrae]|uniref:Transposase-like protein n=1 Tax=Nocardiopsis terrae TaxID=372655 RepID=A0ABR9HG61_9ACTN|nr:helix-turn-helix domain-containing protein [Nocardiopsis terrae]MBE1458014.1 transposase-like protein [Nocardiopsis terrae]GHC83020.1 hypothetical protein GCM10007079_23780 [Nocardiopsis terrae]